MNYEEWSKLAPAQRKDYEKWAKSTYALKKQSSKYDPQVMAAEINLRRSTEELGPAKLTAWRGISTETRSWLDVIKPIAVFLIILYVMIGPGLTIIGKTMTSWWMWVAVIVVILLIWRRR